jgi:Mrp family chromosome partitioning ATPase/uncharacterized protein involved in exopolysaccharide biosynthesis
MTSETQLAHAAGLPVAGTDAHPGMGVHVPSAAAPPPSGLKKIHRLLRGRYPLVLGLGAVMGITCALIGYLSKSPMYESSGTIYMSPTIPSANNTIDEMLPGYSNFLHSQAAWIASRDMVELAMKNPKWQALDKPRDDAAIDDFVSNLDVSEKPNSLIEVTYADPDPKVAQAGAEAICEAYQDFYEAQDPLLITRKINQIDHQRSLIGNDLQLLQAQLSELSKKYGSVDLSEFSNSQMQQLAHLESELSDAEREYVEAQAALAQAQGQNGGATRPSDENVPLDASQIASLGDMGMRQLLAQRTEHQQIVDRLLHSGYGENHPSVVDANEAIAADNDEINSYVTDWNKNFRLSPGAGVTPVFANPHAELDAKRMQVAYLRAQHDKQNDLCHEIGQQVQMIQETRDKIAARQGSLDMLNRNFDELNAQKALMQGQLEIIAQPSVPAEPSHDKRVQFAVLGFIGGGITPAFVMVMIGLIDRRLRYSDETHSDLGGVPLLGILPNLPDLLTDPDQAATAAHCVHQIRTILQITGHTTDRRVFTVTSSSSGDGKTSLTLALGLSFAASGSRTLMVDGDLVGGGLTSRLGITSEHGVLEAMAARDIVPLIRNTDVTDLFLLPVGRALGGYTGSIAPAAVRRMITEARTHFDVIIIDTGPILGSIEASPMAVCADGVIVCVSRGQQRQLVDRALAHLQAIGAKLAGVVFNRAQARDFDHSMSRMSLHPLANGNGHGDQIGPVVSAVASSVRSGLSSHGEHS